MYDYLTSTNLLANFQSGFIKGDSCVNQLLDITHSIHNNLDATSSIDTRGVFLDMSKAFDKVWHDGLMFKPRSYSIESKCLSLSNYIYNPKQ